MKKQTKQKLTELLEASLAATDLDLRDLEASLGELLISTNSCKKSPYVETLRELYSYVYNHVTYGDICRENIIESIGDTLTTFNTPLRQLEEKEAALTRQLKLNEYHKELPLKLLELLAEADDLGLEYKVWFNQLKQPLVEIDGTGIPLNGEPYDYQYAVSIVEMVRQQKEEAQQEAILIAAAKAKLTDEERKLLSL
jgi:hypothetical protein